MLRRLLSGDSLRKSRLHDEKDNLVDMRCLLRNAPPAVMTGLLRLATGYRPPLPWISYSAIRTLAKSLGKTSRVLEFGSGMSTIWYARHAGEVCSVEDCKPWFDKVGEQLNRYQMKNVRYQFAPSSAEYSAFMSDDPGGFDLVMIDGSHRSACVANASTLLKPGGILYLDNSDKDSTPEGGDMRLAEKLALRFADERNAVVTYFTDFAPTQLFVQQGLMVRLRTDGNEGGAPFPAPKELAQGTHTEEAVTQTAGR